MKLKIFDHMQKNDKPERSYADMYANHLEIVEFVDQVGMDFYFVAEHHFDLGFSECPSPGTFLGAASQRTKRIRLGPLVYVLPLWNPIRVAEEVALLDNLTRDVWSAVLAPESARSPSLLMGYLGTKNEKWPGKPCG